MCLVIEKSLPFMLATFSPLGTVSFAWRFPVALFDFFTFDGFFLTGIALTSVKRGSIMRAIVIVNENKQLAIFGQARPARRFKN
jgi:hypothetical protein